MNYYLIFLILIPSLIFSAEKSKAVKSEKKIVCQAEVMSQLQTWLSLSDIKKQPVCSFKEQGIGGKVYKRYVCKISTNKNSQNKLDFEFYPDIPTTDSAGSHQRYFNIVVRHPIKKKDKVQVENWKADLNLNNCNIESITYFTPPHSFGVSDRVKSKNASIVLSKESCAGIIKEHSDSFILIRICKTFFLNESNKIEILDPPPK